MMAENVIETGILVIGGGMAGCFAAIKAREKGVDVTLVDKVTSVNQALPPSLRAVL
jgi:succinate dehydrogenase/fumarate reductase flavoprotein subunit